MPGSSRPGCHAIGPAIERQRARASSGGRAQRRTIAQRLRCARSPERRTTMPRAARRRTAPNGADMRASPATGCAASDPANGLPLHTPPTASAPSDPLTSRQGPPAPVRSGRPGWPLRRASHRVEAAASDPPARRAVRPDGSGTDGCAPPREEYHRASGTRAAWPHGNERRLLASDRRSQAAKLYARTAAVHERSARLLRAGGHVAAADHAELLAAVARDRISESAAVARMYLLARRFRDASRLGELLDQALDGAVAFLAADFGNIQLTDPQTKRCGSSPSAVSPASSLTTSPPSRTSRRYADAPPKPAHRP